MNEGMRTTMMNNLGRKRPGFLLGGLALAFLLASPYRTAAQDKDLDRIIFKEGRTVKATVLQDDYDKLVYVKVGRKQKEEAASKIDRVVYGGLPQAFLDGDKAERAADQGAQNAQNLYENAARSYELAANSAKRAPVKALALYRAALCRMKLGLKNKTLLPTAVKAFQAFLGFAPKSRFSLRARLELARCHRLNGNLAGGLKVLDAFSKRILDETLPVKWDALVLLERIRTLLAGGKPRDAAPLVDGAGRALDEIQPKTDEVRALRVELEFLQGKIKIESKDFSGAETYFQALLNKASKDPDLRTVAYAGLGETYYARGMAKKSEEDLWKAYFNFARAYVLDVRDREMGARVLYYQGATLLALGPLKAGRDSAATAKGYFNQVVKFFPLSDFAALAADKLK